jgi:nucleotide-binding universal stress UspA family protein
VIGQTEGDRVQAFLVPLDRSELARTALVAAQELSSRVQADVYILSVVARPDQVADIEAELAALPLPDRIADIAVVIGDPPARIINQTLHGLGPAALCMATRARGLRPFGLGSMAYEALAAGAAPVILVGPSLGYPEGIPWADDPIHLEKFRGGGVVVCVDGGERSASLAATARPWARRLNEPLIVLTVAEPDAPLLSDELPEKAYGPPGNVNTFLDRLTAPLRGDDVTVKSRAVFDPVGPAEGIRIYLQKSPAVLVVVGCQLRRGRLRPPGARTAAAILRRSPSPVLVVPRPESGHQTG